jgi:peroxiredoxin
LKPLRIGIAVLLVAGAVAYVWANRGRYAPLEVGRPAPHYAAPDLAGDTVRLADLRGSVVVLNVWATWCAPCIREMPSLQRLADRFADRGLVVVGVSVDADGGLAGGSADVRAFVERLGLTFTILHDARGVVERLFGVSGLPMTFVIDRDGRIHQKVLGEREWDGPELAAEIEALLES